MFNMIDRFGVFLNRWSITKKVLAGVFIAGFVLSLIPVVTTCFYSVPVYDDYNFGFYSHKSVVEGGSFLAGVFTSVIRFYMDWQGFFTSSFWASVQPFNIDVNFYFISNMVVLIVLIVAFMFFGKVVLRDVLNADLSTYFLITIPIMFMYIQFMPSLSEGLYWMDGALSNAITGILLLILSCAIKVYISESKKAKIIYSILAIILTLAICGSSLMIYITLMEFCVVSLIYSIKKKNPVYKLLIAIMIIYTIGIVVAAIAPGNAVRLESSNGGMSVVSAILYALFYSVTYFGKWGLLVFISVLVFVCVVFYPIAKKSNYQFRNPLLVFVLLYLLYASRMSIQLFTMGYLGAPRQINQYYFGYIICMTISVLYFVGWLSKKGFLCIKNEIKRGISVVLILFCAFTFLAGCFQYGVKNISFISTSISYIKGETQQYSKEMKERINVYEDVTKKEAIVKPLSVYPVFFVEEPLTTNESYWTNRSVAKYYDKETVKLLEK